MAVPNKRILLVGNDGTQYYEILIKADDNIENETRQTVIENEIQAEIPPTASSEAPFNEHSYTTRRNDAEQSADAAVADEEQQEEQEQQQLLANERDSASNNETDNEDSDVWFSPWTHSAILALLEAYKGFADDFNGGRSRKRNVWNKVAKIMLNNGFNVTPEICDQKWRNLLLTYRKILRRREQNPEKRSSWVYFDLIKEIMSLPPKENHPDNVPIMPRNIKFRAIRKKPEITLRPNVVNVSTFCEQNKTNSTSTVTLPVKPVQNQPYSAPHWFLIFAKEQQKQHQEQMQTIKQMHEDIVELEKEKNSLLKDLVNTIQKSYGIP